MSSLEDFDIPSQHAVITLEGADGNVARLVEELGRFAAASRYVVGITVESRAMDDNTAFTGGHTSEHRDDYATMTVSLDSDEGIRYATSLLIPDERLAEITDTYTLPEHLKNPTNHADAFIGYIIKGLTGYEEDTSKSYIEQAEASTDTVVITLDATPQQTQAFKDFGQVNISNAQKNVLYRGQQVETMEHVLRFLIARESNKFYNYGNLFAGVDYEWATGILADALAIVNGKNGFNEDDDPTTNDLIYRGMLAQKSSIAAREGVVYYSGADGPQPVWPPEAVKTYEAEQMAAEKARQEALLKKRRLVAEQSAVREAEIAAQRAAIEQAAERMQGIMDSLEEEGFTWTGIMPLVPDGPLNSAAKVRKHYMRKYDLAEEDVHVLEDVAVYGGNNIQVSSGNVTVYVRKDKA